MQNDRPAHDGASTQIDPRIDPQIDSRAAPAAHREARRIVLTGGPGSGKTTACHLLAQRLGERIRAVPEAATQIYTALGKRWDQIGLAPKRIVQQQIYHLQIQQENAALVAGPVEIVLLDRGTLDGAAYWPEGPADYLRVLGTSFEQELSRYHAVIWLQTAAVLGVYDGTQSNATRFEDARAAIASGQRVRALWAGHKNFQEVGAYPTFAEKITAIVERLELRR